MELVRESSWRMNSVRDCEEAIELLQRTRAMLAAANLRLHKNASNNVKVMQAFSLEDQASDLRNLDLRALRVSVEWIFGCIKNYFKFIDFKSQQKINLGSVGR